jgi:hypothetical protein
MRRLVLLFLLSSGIACAAWDALPAVDLAKLRPADFRDSELDLPYDLAHFHRQSVVEQGPDRGFINIQVWRSPRDNKPYNARIMESILSLAYFYTYQRPWNPYYGSPAVRQRLEASMEFWLHLQNPEGRFAEAAPQRWNLAATAFSTKFMGQALTLLKGGPPIEPALLERVVVAVRKTIRLVLTDPGLYKYGMFVSNQYTNVFAGGLAFLKLYPDAEIESLLRRRFQDGVHDHQSPAGYFYEEDGPDFRYDMFTHQSNLQMAWDYARGGDLGKLLAEQERKWFEWLAWNAVPEPNWSGWILNHAIETRSRLATFPGKDTPIGEAAPEARAFATSREDLRQEIALERRKLELSWPAVPPLQPDSYSPYAFLLRDHRTWYPTEAERDAARKKLPCFARNQFTHQLMDSRHPLVFTYVRRPAYYAAFNAGKQLSTHRQQRFGLGLLWSETTGAVLQSQSGSNTAAWGTAAAGASSVYEAAGVDAVYRVGGETVEARPGSVDLPSAELTVTYALGSQGEKSLEFATDAIVVRVRHPGEFTEFVPMLQAADDKPAGFALSADSPATISTQDSGIQVASRRVVVWRLAAKDSLAYRLWFTKSGGSR